MSFFLSSVSVLVSVVGALLPAGEAAPHHLHQGPIIISAAAAPSLRHHHRLPLLQHMSGLAGRAVHGTLVKIDPDMKKLIKFLIDQKSNRYADVVILEELDHEYWLMSTAGIPIVKREIQAHHERMHKEVKEKHDE
jgi:hypothetical protein